MPRRLLPWLAALALGGCSLPSFERPALLGGELSIEKEREMTAEIHHQIRSQVSFVSDPVILAYLNEIGQSLVKAASPPPFLFRFSLLEGDELNAFTIGGGYVYVSSGVLAQAGDVAELAGVLAHEIAHVRKRHIAKAQESQGLATLATLAATAAVIFAGGDPGLIAIPQGINVSIQLKHSRSHESEADREGIVTLVRAGYDPRGMIHFFQRILAEHPRSGQELPAYLYTHPALRDRIDASRTEIARLHPPPDLRKQDERLARMQRRLALVLSPVAGGSGLQARPVFDREISDPYLTKASRLQAAGRLEAAERTLAEGEARQPEDPRLPLARAELAESRADLESARRHLERAFELDPSVPLVLYRLGRIHRRLGNRSQALFYLEQAATRYSSGSSGRQRAELEIEQLSFRAFERSGLGPAQAPDSVARFHAGDDIIWWAKLSHRMQAYNPVVRVRWVAPNGSVALDESLRMGPLGRISSTLPSERDGLSPGRWTVRISLGDSVVEQRVFLIVGSAADEPSDR